MKKTALNRIPVPRHRLSARTLRALDELGIVTWAGVIFRARNGSLAKYGNSVMIDLRQEAQPRHKFVEMREALTSAICANVPGGEK